ncbi:MAG: phage tail protein [Salibacteraceae bacterium]
MDPFLAQIMIFAGNFAPRGWAFCEGQLLPIASNSALFSLLGTTYGGDGRTTFALPDLRGRSGMHPGHGPGLTNRKLGQKLGVETTTLNITQLAAHSHVTINRLNGAAAIQVSTSDGEEVNPNGNYLSKTDGSFNFYLDEPEGGFLAGASGDVTGAMSVVSTGNSSPYNNRQPFLAMNYIIALQGIFPSRS